MENYIDNKLNPSKKNLLDSTKDDCEEINKIDEILASLEISKHDYKEALSISEDNDFQIHYKWPPNSCFVNNYFCDGLMAWEANMNIQPLQSSCIHVCLFAKISKLVFSCNETSSKRCL